VVVCINGLEKKGDPKIPTNHIPLSHFVKHFAPTIQKPAFHIRINYSIAIIQIRSKPINQNRLRVNLQCLVTRK
jgi:hypothetical protein